MNAPPHSPDYITAQSRVASFEAKKATAKKLRWPHPSTFGVTPAMLASAGFYHDPADGEPDRTTCWMCMQSMKGWEEGDDPWALHLAYGADCPVARLASLERARDLKQPTWSDSPDHDWGDNDEWHPRSSLLINARLASFGGREGRWVHEGEKGVPTREQLAKAGFHFAPYLKKKGKLDVDDTTVCCYCDRNVSGWEADDDPVAIHLKYGSCVFFTAPDVPSTTAKGKKAAASKKGKKSAVPSAPPPPVEEMEIVDETVQVEEEEVEEDEPEVPKSKKGRAPKATAAKKAPTKSRRKKVAADPEPTDDEEAIEPPSVVASGLTSPAMTARSQLTTSTRTRNLAASASGTDDVESVASAPTRSGRTRAGSVAVEPAPAPAPPVPKNGRGRQAAAAQAEESTAEPAASEVPLESIEEPAPRMTRTRAGSVLAASTSRPNPSAPPTPQAAKKGRARAGTASGKAPAAVAVEQAVAEDEAETPKPAAKKAPVKRAPKGRGKASATVLDRTPEVEGGPEDVDMAEQEDERAPEPIVVEPKQTKKKPTPALRSPKVVIPAQAKQTKAKAGKGAVASAPAEEAMDIDDAPAKTRVRSPLRSPKAVKTLAAPLVVPKVVAIPDSMTPDEVFDVYVGKGLPPAPVPNGWLPNPLNPQRPLPPLTEEEKAMKLPVYYQYLAEKEEQAFLDWVDKSLMAPWLKKVEVGRQMIRGLPGYRAAI